MPHQCFCAIKSHSVYGTRFTRSLWESVIPPQTLFNSGAFKGHDFGKRDVSLSSLSLFPAQGILCGFQFYNCTYCICFSRNSFHILLPSNYFYFISMESALGELMALSLCVRAMVCVHGFSDELQNNFL